MYNSLDRKQSNELARAKSLLGSGMWIICFGVVMKRRAKYETVKKADSICM
jgi:hypothetical protein